MARLYLRSRLILVLLLAGVGIAACGTRSVPSLSAPPAASSSAPSANISAGEELHAQVVRVVATAPDADLHTLTAGNTAFALDLYHALGQADGNLFFSPHSIVTALTMTSAGAAGTTADQMRSTLHMMLPPERLHGAFNALDTELTRQRSAEGSGSPAATPFTLRQANALWGQRDHAFRPAFLDLLAKQYGAGLRLIDFRAGPEPARAQINAWVSRQTEQKITDLLPAGAVTGDTQLVLTNAIYFKADWQKPFDPNMTQDGPFTRPDGKQVTARMMSQTAGFAYGAGPNYQAVRLDYAGDASMIVLLPAPGTLQSFEASLTPARLQQMLDGMRLQDVMLTLPKVTTKAAVRLKPVLSGLGMHDAFTDQANFSAMDGTRTLLIGDVYHQATMIIDEKGTEAAAATAVAMMEASAAVSPLPVMRVDHPFIVLIRDTHTGALLFAGRITDPRS